MLRCYNFGGLGRPDISRIDMISKGGKDTQITINCEAGHYSFIVVNNKAVTYSSAKFSDHAELESAIAQCGVQKASCNVVMRPGTYNLFLIDKPMVPEKEMTDAVGWVTKGLVKDLSYKDPLVVHFYDHGPQMHIVVAEKSTVAFYKDLILRLGLRLGTMTIAELAVVNILPRSMVAYVTIIPGKTNSAVFALGGKLMGVKKLPVVQGDDYKALWEALEQHIEHYQQGECKVLLAPTKGHGAEAEVFKSDIVGAADLADDVLLLGAGGALNLFKSAPRDFSAIPSAKHILWSWGVALVCAVGVHIMLLQQHNKTVTEAEVIKAELVALFSKIDEVVAGESSRKLAGVVKDSKVLNRSDPYGYFHQLAVVKNDKVWLTDINLDFERAMFTLHGRALDAAAMYRMANSAVGPGGKALELKNVKNSGSEYSFELARGRR